MKIVNGVKPGVRARILKAVEQTLDQFDPQGGAQYDKERGKSIFIFSCSLSEYDWDRKPIYDPDDWNSVKSIKPPKRGVYRTKTVVCRASDTVSGERLAYWDGEHWRHAIDGPEMGFGDRTEALFKEIEHKYLE